MINLLEETIQALTENNRPESDVRWVGTREVKTTWDKFKVVADTEYRNGYGAAKVAQDLLIVGDNWWLERLDYDGSEWWEYKELPPEPEANVVLRAVTVNQSANDLVGWENLDSINQDKDD